MENSQNTETIELLRTTKDDLWKIDPRNIVIEEGFNVREDMGDIEALLKSILEMGQIDPVIGYKKRGEDKFVLTEGHRRHAAFMLGIELGHDMGKMKLVIGSSNPEDRIFSMIATGIGKKRLTVIEEAEAYKRLINMGYKAAEIARKVVKTNAHISNLLKLAEVPKEVKNEIVKGNIKGTTVLAILKETKDDFSALTNRVKKAVAVMVEAEEKQATLGSTKKAKKKVTTKEVGILTPMQKFAEVAELLTDNESEKAELIKTLFILLRDKESTVENIVALCK